MRLVRARRSRAAVVAAAARRRTPGCLELPVAGIDVIELSTPYDQAEITAYLANRVCPGVPERHALRRAPPPGPGRGGRRGRADRRGRARRPTSRRRPARASRWSTSPAACSRPGSSTPTSTRSRAVSSGSGATCPGHEGRDGYLAAIASYAADHPEVAVDPRRRLGDAGLPGRHADRGRPRPGGGRPARLPAQPGPPRSVGQQPGARAGRGRRPDAGPAARTDRAGRRRPPDRHPPRGGDAAGRPSRPGRRPATTTTAASSPGSATSTRSA